MVQAVSLRLLTAEAGDRSWASPCEVCGAHSGNDAGFSPSFCIFPLSVSFHQCYILTFIYTGMRNWRKLGTFQKQYFFWDDGTVERKIDYSHFLSKCRPSVCKIQNSTLKHNFVLLLHMVLMHFHSPCHFHFLRFLISKILPPPNGWADAVCEHSEQEIFSSPPK